MSAWRPLRHRLSDEAMALMTEQRASGQSPMPVRLMLVDDHDPAERSRVACGDPFAEAPAETSIKSLAAPAPSKSMRSERC